MEVAHNLNNCSVKSKINGTISIIYIELLPLQLKKFNLYRYNAILTPLLRGCVIIESTGRLIIVRIVGRVKLNL